MSKRPVLQRALPGGRLSLIDRYLVTQMVPGMAIAFGVVLIALLLYRILDLFNQLAESSARFGLILAMVGNLAPHYLGLAIPAAYFISMFLVVAKLADTSEIDALLASGLSILRLTVPFVWVGVIVAAVSIILLGFLQPYGRYGFNADLNAALYSGWDARLQPRTFVSPGGGVTVMANKVDPAGRALEGVFVRRQNADGEEQVFTARRGALIPSPDGSTLRLVLNDGQQFQQRTVGEPVVGRFDTLTVDQPFSIRPPPFRMRGSSTRELSLFELFDRANDAPTHADREKAASELHTRIVRSISIPLLPMLALPLGMASKRKRRGAGVVLSAVVLFLYEHAIDLGQSLADLGQVSALVAVWTPFLVFTALCTWLYSHSLSRPGETPFSLMMERIDRLFDVFRRLRPAT